MKTTTRPWWNGCGDQVREELLAGQRRRVGRGHLLQRAGRPEQALHRVVAEERGEQAAHRRQAADRARPRRRDALRLQPVASASSAASTASPAIISEKKMPIDSDEPELKNVPRMPRGRAALVGPARCS